MAKATVSKIPMRYSDLSPSEKEFIDVYRAASPRQKELIHEWGALVEELRSKGESPELSKRIRDLDSRIRKMREVHHG